MKLKGSLEISVMNQDLILLTEKALYWKDSDILIVSDMHLGKSGHFRKHGIAVPESINTSNLQNLDKLIQQLEPVKIIFLGDLFHSQYNAEFESFKNWRKIHSDIEMILTIGNHDIISRHEFEKIGLECVNTYTISPFIFMHDKQGKTNTDFLPVSGHIHPAVKLRTRGRQNIFTPCYYVGNSNILLPAFGTFTGTYLIEPGQNDLVFAIVDGEVVDVSSLI